MSVQSRGDHGDGVPETERRSGIRTESTIFPGAGFAVGNLNKILPAAGVTFSVFSGAA